MHYGLRKHSANLIRRELVAKDTYELVFLMKDEFFFVPGQYVWVELEQLSFDDPRGNRRAFSICCTPNGSNSISILFRKSSSGYKKTLLKLPLKSQVNIYGPFGALSLPASKENPIILIAGGVGIAPFCSMICEEIEKKSKRSIRLIYANHDKQHASYISKFKKITKAHPSFVLQEVYGDITLNDLKKISNIKNALIYTIGPVEMVDAVGEILASLKVSNKNLFFEEFYPKKFAPENALYVNNFPITEELFMLAMQNTSNHIVLTDLDGKVIFANKAAELLTGYSFEEMRGQTARLWGGLMDKSVYADLWKTIKIKQKPFNSKVYNRRKDGVVYTALMRVSPILEKSDKLIGFMSTEEDITELEKINASKTEFVSLTSHQLRTPLTVIRWDTEELLSKSGKDALNPEQKKSLDEVYQKTQEMIDLIQKLLNVSNLELGQYFVKVQPTDLLHLAQKTLLECEHTIKEKKLKINEKFESNLFDVPTDPEFIKIILQNLITNAVKYTSYGGNVEIEISLNKRDGVEDVNLINDKNIFIRVSDSGIGIPLQQQSRMFQEFSRAENAKTFDSSGYGFGLYMTKLIVGYLSGKIWFESEVGKGTTFYVLLPTL